MQQHRRRRVRPPRRGSDDVLEVAAMEMEDARLHRIPHRRLELRLAFAELPRAPRLRLTVDETAVHDRARRAPHRDVGEVQRLLELAREQIPAVDLAVRSRDVRKLEVTNDAAPATEKRELTVAELLAAAHGLRGDDDTL